MGKWGKPQATWQSARVRDLFVESSRGHDKRRRRRRRRSNWGKPQDK
jgi:hypothetical protein